MGLTGTLKIIDGKIRTSQSTLYILGTGSAAAPLPALGFQPLINFSERNLDLELKSKTSYEFNQIANRALRMHSVSMLSSATDIETLL